jgi:phosphoadenosine phosphosulfate reductase
MTLVASPSSELLESLARASVELERASAPDIVRWAIERYFPRLTMATAFGAEGCCLVHMIAEVEPRVRIFNLETGYQFPETLALRDQIAERYGIEVEYVRADTTAPEYEARHGGPQYQTNPDQCCHDRKIVPLRRAIEGYDGWISAIRRDQTVHRRNAPIVQWDAKFGLVKVNPLVNWTKKDVWKFILDHKVPYNPLHDRGYPSIGCWPCTRAVGGGEDDRAGRWSGSDKKECGLHLDDAPRMKPEPPETKGEDGEKT